MSTDLSSLIAGLSHTQAGKRAEAAEQIAQLGPKARSAAVALVLACGDEAESVRQWAVDALKGIGPPETEDVEQLASLVEARSPDVGYWAANLLGELKAEAAPAIDGLAKVVAGNGDPSVRQEAAWALGEIGPAAASALPALRQAAAASDPRLSCLAGQAIRQVAGR